MIILDTNVISEALRERLATAAPVLAELLTGVATMPEGRRKDVVASAAGEFLATLAGRIWPFDEPAAVEYAAIVAERRAVGQPITVVDAQIAAIARSRETLAWPPATLTVCVASGLS